MAAMARVVVVGGGFGGMAVAARLAKLGHAVTLLERGTRLGGALVPVEQDGFAWDGGPTYTVLPAVVRDLFRKSGRPAERELELIELDVLREHRFPDGSSVRPHRSRRSRASDPASGPGGPTTCRATRTTGRCSAGSTSSAPGTPRTCRARWPTGSAAERRWRGGSAGSGTTDCG
jgi:phytoene dehydrogenase-like protein